MNLGRTTNAKMVRSSGTATPVVVRSTGRFTITPQDVVVGILKPLGPGSGEVLRVEVDNSTALLVETFDKVTPVYYYRNGPDKTYDLANEI